MTCPGAQPRSVLLERVGSNPCLPRHADCLGLASSDQGRREERNPWPRQQRPRREIERVASPAPKRRRSTWGRPRATATRSTSLPMAAATPNRDRPIQREYMQGLPNARPSHPMPYPCRIGCVAKRPQPCGRPASPGCVTRLDALETEL